MKKTLSLNLFLAFCFGLSGCFSEESPRKEPEQKEEPPVLVDPFKSVCDPMGSIAPKPTRAKGLVADLYNLPPALTSHIRKAADFQEQGRKLDARIFFTQLFIPTRRFELGFITQKGDSVKNENGGSLDEWFGLHIESAIKLDTEKKAGLYQFAILADDGATLRIDTGNGFETLIDNDGAHQSRFGCAQKAIQLDPQKRLPIQVDFFQGPRYHIALALLYRSIPGEGSLYDPTCGITGNDLFFDSSQTPSVPTTMWKELLKRGWKVVPADEYYLPEKVGANPCAVPRFNVFRKS